MDASGRVSRLFRKFAHLYDAGVPLAEALDLAGRGLPDAFRAAVDEVVDDLYRGTSVADAMAARPEFFGPDLVGVIRSGERRGELAASARHLADGLESRVLDAVEADHEGLDRLLERFESAVILHLDAPSPGRDAWVVRVRRPGRRLKPVEVDAGPALLAAVAERAAGDGAPADSFLWEDRLVRVALQPTAGPTTAVLRLSGPVPAPPEGVAAWWSGPPTVYVVAGPRGFDRDAPMRGVLAALPLEDLRCVGAAFPVPGVLQVEEDAGALDPDVFCVADPGVVHPLHVQELLRGGVHVLVGVQAPRLKAVPEVLWEGLDPLPYVHWVGP